MEKIRFNALTPENLTEELEPYKDALDFSLDMTKTDITNIAVTGGYGAGKSSVIQSYIQEAGIQKKALNISLASFDLKKEKGKPGNKLDLETIELKILQQLIHQVHPSNLPKSRFERIEHDVIEWDKTLYHTVLSIAFIFVITVFISKVFFDKELLPMSYPFYLFSLFVSGGFLFSFSTYLVNKGIFSKQDIESIDLLSGKAVFKESNVTSPLSLFLDEILYFFEVTDYSIVVFEDLDRLEHIEILSRLRELNQLINASGQVKRPIKFIYAVKDDLFVKSEDRVKFFDFIVPVIPVMDYANSYTLLKVQLKKTFPTPHLAEILDENTSLLSDCSQSINDLRILNNIINEYIIFLNNAGLASIFKAGIDSHPIPAGKKDQFRKIFSLIVYKNLMPEDFGLIKNRESILCKITQDRHERKGFIYEKFLEIEKSFSELDKALDTAIELGYDNEDMHQSWLEAKTQRDSIQHQYSLKEFLKKIEDLGDWEWEKKYCPEYDIEANTPVIFMLMREGYLDEDYLSYISVSHEKNPNLQSFKNSLLHKTSFEKSFNIHLSNELIEHFLKEVSKGGKDYSIYSNILNFDLMCTLITHNKHQVFLQKIINTHFKLERNFHIEFLTYFIQRAESMGNSRIIQNLFKEIFGSLATIQEKNAFYTFVEKIKSIDDESALKSSFILYFMVAVFPHEDIGTKFLNLEQTNLDNFMTEISEITNFVNKASSVNFLIIDNVMRWIEYFPLKIKLTEPRGNSQGGRANELFKKIVKNNCYEINQNNIESIFKAFKKPEDQLLAQNYTAIIENFARDTDFRKYIEANISQYVNDILLEQKLGVMESNEAMIALINNESLSNDQRMKLIKQHQDLCFKADFEKINFKNILHDQENEIGFCQLLFTYDLERRKEDKAPVIHATWDNVYWGICSNNTLTKELQNEWLMIACNEIVKSDLPTDEEMLNLLKELIAFNNDLNFESYSVLMKHLNIVLESGEDLEKISQFSWDKIEFLMKEDFIEVSPNTIQAIYDNHIKEEDDE